MTRRCFLFGSAFLISLGWLANAPAAAQNPAIKIGVNRNLIFLPVWVAKEKGFYQARGVDVTLQEIGGGVEVRTALLSGAVEFIIQSPEGSALLYEQGQKLVNLVATMGKLTWALVLRKGLQGSVRPGDLAALKGLKIGVTGRGAASDLQLQALLRNNGLPADYVTIIASGNFNSAVAAMDHGQLDGVMIIETAKSQAIARGAFIHTDFASGDVYKGSSAIPSGSIATTARYLEGNRDTAKKIVDAVVDAMIFMAKDPDWTAKYVAGLAKLDAGTARAIVDKEFAVNSPAITEAGWDTLITILRDGGMIKKSAPYAEVVAKDMSPLWARYFAEVPGSGSATR